MSEVERLSDGLKMVVSTGLMSRDALLATTNDLTVIEAALKQADVFLSGDIRPEIMSAAQTRYVLETDGNQYRNWVVSLFRLLVLRPHFYRQSKISARATKLNVSFC